ncbi:MAG: VCBS repeat-containing protein [Planctomycetes bacterium]|nr:VCBS repeat-containing protein [Planctomycetota bacterium]
MRRILSLASVLLGLSSVANPQTIVDVSRFGDASQRMPGISTITQGAAANVPLHASLMAPILEPGWPVTVSANSGGNFHPTRGVAFADLDLDGRLEIIRPSTDGFVYVWRHDGTNFPGWPVFVTAMPQTAPAVADLDGDGIPEIVIATRGLTSGGRAYVFRADGTAAPGWPKSFNNGNVEATPTLVDLDGDGVLEILWQERAYPIGYVRATYLDGTPYPGNWPYALDHVPTGTPAVADLDGDGDLEIVMMSYTSLHVLDAQGNGVAGFPVNVNTRFRANFSYQSPALGDLDGDGDLEIVTACHQSGSGCYVFQHDGSLLPGWPKSFGGTWTYSPPTLVDLDRDGRLDVLCGRAGGTVSAPAMYAWTGAGTLIPGFPVVHPGGAEAPIAVADFDLDGQLDIVFDSNLMETASGQGWLHAVDDAGQAKAGWPLRVPGFTHMNGAQFADVDGDGQLEMAVVSRDGTTVTVALYEPAPVQGLGEAPWRTYHEGVARRGLVHESDRFDLVGDARPGGVMHVELQGEPGHGMVLFASGGLAVLPLPGLGVLRLDPALALSPIYDVTLGATGRHLVDFPVPNTPSLSGQLFAVQAVDISPTLTIALREVRPIRFL